LAWTIEWSDSALKNLRALDRQQARRLRDFLRDRIAPAQDPRHLGDPLTGPLAGFWRYRVGDYRLLCRLEDAACVVLVVTVGHRREIYR
jgi:mRNA interferase RelE/StbE